MRTVLSRQPCRQAAQWACSSFKAVITNRTLVAPARALSLCDRPAAWSRKNAGLPGRSLATLSAQALSIGSEAITRIVAECPSTPESQEQDPVELKKAAIREALAQGTLGMGFSAGGFLYCYHLGVLWELAKLGILPPSGGPGQIKLAGASAGALAIVSFACGLDVAKATEALLSFAADCRAHGTQGRLGLLLQDFLHSYLPDDVAERCRDRCYVSITTLHRSYPPWRPLTVHRFENKDDLVQALITSSHIPVYASGRWTRKFRGMYAIDGGITNFLPTPPSPHVVKVSERVSVCKAYGPASSSASLGAHNAGARLEHGYRTVIKVCCFPVSQILSKIQPMGIAGMMPQKVASLLDASISPDAFEPFPHSYQQVASWALVPGDDEVIKYLILKGRQDAFAWATSMGLALGHQAPGSQEKQPVAGEEHAERTLQQVK